MATYQWGDVITLVKPYVKQIPTSAVEVLVCDEIHSRIWRRHFWRWSTLALTPIALVNNQQDYALTAPNLAAFFRLWRARITQTDVTPDIDRELLVWKWLPPALDAVSGMGGLRGICFEGTISKLRLDAAVSVALPTTLFINGEFQKIPTKVTATATDLVFPEQYMNVAAAGVLWKFYLLGDDPRAETQFGKFMFELNEMAEAENEGEAQTQRLPDQAMGAIRSGSPGLFGWF